MFCSIDGIGQFALLVEGNGLGFVFPFVIPVAFVFCTAILVHSGKRLLTYKCTYSDIMNRVIELRRTKL